VGMPVEFEQYAAYWVPKRNDPLARFGASWTGWCAERGARRDQSALDGISIDIPKVTRQLWRHGFHAVIKAPFRLCAGRSRFSVEHVLGRLSEDSAAFELPRLQLAVVHGSVALVSFQSCSALGDLVTQVDKAVATLELAAPAECDTLLRKSKPDSDASATADTVIPFPTSSAHRFQIPLTDRLNPKIAQETMEALRPLLEPMLDLPRRMNDVALMGDPGGGRPLRVLEFYELPDPHPQCKSSALPVQGPDILVPMPTSRTSDPGIAR
jgi:uncharacterized protein DUF1045